MVLYAHMPEQDPIAHIPGSWFGRGGAQKTTERLFYQEGANTLPDIPSLLEATAESLSQSEYDHVANVQMGTAVQNLRALIFDHIQELGIPLPMKEEDNPCMDGTLLNMLAMLHDRASELALRNWRLVPFSLRKIQDRDLFGDEVVDHVCQAGFSGLLFAAKCWDPWYGAEDKRGDIAYANHFSTFAVPTIVGYMKRSLVEYLPAGVGEKAYFQFQRFQRALSILQRWFDDASEEDAVRFMLIWEQMERRPNRTEFLALAESAGMADRWRMLWQRIKHTEAALREISLDESGYLFRRDELTGEMGEIEVDPHVVFGFEAASPEELAIQRELASETDVILSGLSLKDRGLVERRFGFWDGRKWTFEEIALEYGVTRNTICNRFHRILTRLQHPTLRKRLRVFLE